MGARRGWLALTEQGEAAAAELSELLDIRGGERSYRVNYGYLPTDDREIALVTRSIVTSSSPNAS